MGWLKDAVIELLTRLFRHIFMGAKSSDGASKDDDDKKLSDQVKKDGW